MSQRVAAGTLFPQAPGPPVCSPPQIIGLVQSQGAHGLEPLQPDQLPAGPLPCWERYAALMEACLAPDPASRPKFEQIVQELGCGHC